jgi:hypothetical protein
MLSVSARRWTDGGRWVLPPKWDGFRLLASVGADHQVRAWSRHGTDLTARLGSLLAPFADEVVPGTTFDGELVAIGERDGESVQDFATVTCTVFTGQPAATERLRFVAFDSLAVAGEDVRPLPWPERDARSREALPLCERLRMVASQLASLAAHEAIVALGFEGTVPKRPGSAYRPGRQRAWIKLKARLRMRAKLQSVHQDRERVRHALCNIDGRRVHRSPAHAPLIGLGSSSSSSTRASTPTAASARSASCPSPDRESSGGSGGRGRRVQLKSPLSHVRCGQLRKHRRWRFRAPY